MLWEVLGFCSSGMPSARIDEKARAEITVTDAISEHRKRYTKMYLFPKRGAARMSAITPHASPIM